MESELKVLSIIGENNASMTQRYLSARTNLSLGAVNLLLRRMLEKGLIKIEKLNSHTMRYILTPQGMMEKAKKTYDFIKRTYEGILIMKSELDSVVQELPENSKLYLYGEDNEVCQMATLLLREITENHGVFLKKLNMPDDLSRDEIVIIWNSADEDRFIGHRCVNLLQCMM